jgi:potassium-transporting ATPase KdpC subunit
VILVRWFNSLLRQTVTALLVLVTLTVVTGVVYPLAVYGVGHLPGLAGKAEGSVVRVNGQPVGSQHIGVDLTPANPNQDPYFHGRPSYSALDSSNPTDPKNALAPGNPDSSGGTNFAESNDNEVKLVQERQAAIAQRESVPASMVPPDAVTASASGVDPDISPAYAYLQVPRVARVNHLPDQVVRQAVDRLVQGRSLGFVGEPTVNVLDLDLAVHNLTQH